MIFEAKKTFRSTKKLWTC